MAQIGDGPLTNTSRGNLKAHAKILEDLSQQCDVIYENHMELLKDAYQADLTSQEYIDAHTGLNEQYQELMDDVDNIRDMVVELLDRTTIETPQKQPPVVATTQSVVTTDDTTPPTVTTAAMTTTTASNTTTTTTCTGTRPKMTASQKPPLPNTQVHLSSRSDSPQRTTGRGLGFSHYPRGLYSGSRYGVSHQAHNVPPNHSPGLGGHGIFRTEGPLGPRSYSTPVTCVSFFSTSWTKTSHEA